MSDGQRAELEAEYLTRLMRRDAKIWNTRMYSIENAPLAEPFDYETNMEMAAMRGRIVRKREAAS
jgi:hypothetical protein